MNNDEWRDKWHLCDLQMMRSLSGITETPGQVYEVDITKLNSNLQKMPGIQSVFVSGCIVPQDAVPEDLSNLGEFVLLREDTGISKTYNYVFAASGDNFYFNGPYKDFDDHHTPTGEAVNINGCFGNIPNRTCDEK